MDNNSPAIKIYLKRNKEESLLRRHPWVFSGAISHADGEPEEGDIADVYNSRGEFVARGHCQIGSISVRVLTFEQEDIDARWWEGRLAGPLALRKALGLAGSACPGEEQGTPAPADPTGSTGPAVPDGPAATVAAIGLVSPADSAANVTPTGHATSAGTAVNATPADPATPVPPTDPATPATPAVPAATNCYRLIHGEGDFLPGLIIDIYGSIAVVQCHSVGMYLSRNEICNALCKIYGESLQAVYDKSSRTVPFNAGLDAVDGYLWKADGFIPPDEYTVVENGNKFAVNWERGQKTGFFLDQRDNRALVGRYARGRRVLNTFCYTGGFSVYALAGGAVSVDSVDSSEHAMELTARNMELNFGPSAPHRPFTADATKFVREMDAAYDMIILDPPAFAKHLKAVPNALQGYKRLNSRAISAIAPGGILFTFSCSQAVTVEQFRTTVFTAAAIAGRNVRILHQLTQPADHPVNIYHPEGEYLKGFVLYVE